MSKTAIETIEIFEILTNELAPHISFESHEQRDEWLYNFDGNFPLSELSQEALEAWYWYANNIAYAIPEKKRILESLVAIPNTLSNKDINFSTSLNVRDMLKDIEEKLVEEERAREKYLKEELENMELHKVYSWEAQEQNRYNEIQYGLSRAYHMLMKHRAALMALYIMPLPEPYNALFKG